jgi:hypothetical protein
MRRRSLPDRSREGAVGSEETIMLDSNLPSVPRRDPWNKGRLIGQKRPLKPKDVWSIRVRLQVERRARNLALFNLAIDSISCAAAISFRCGSMAYAPAVECEIAAP